MPNFYAPYDSSSSGSGLQTLKDMMSLKQSQQALQSGALTMQGQQSQNQSLAAKAQMDTQGAAQNQAAGRFFQNFDISKHIKDDGTLDLESALTSPDFKSTGSDAPDIAKKLIDIKNSQLDAKSKLASVNGTLRDQFRQTVGGLSADPDVVAGNATGKGKVLDAVGQFAQSGGADAQRIAQVYSPVFQNAPPGKLGEVLKNTQLQAVSAGQQADVTKAGGMTNQGQGGMEVRNNNPYAAQPVGSQVGQTMRQGITPGMTTLPNQQLGVVGPGGSVRAAPAVDSSGSASLVGKHVVMPSERISAYPRPGINAQGADQQRYTKTMSDAAQHVQDVSSAANDPQNGIGSTRYRNDQILDIVNNEKPPTGPGMASLNWIASKIPGESGDAFQRIGHYLAQNSAAIASKMGVPNTNMGSETAAAASGNTAQNPGAIKEITKVNDALNTAFDYYNRGLAKASANGADPSKVPAFKQAFGQNFDVNAFRYDDDLRRGDKTDAAKIEAALGNKNTPQGKAAYQAFGRKVQVLKSLRDTGDMP